MNDSDKSAEQRMAEAVQRSVERGTDWSQAWALLTASAATFGGLPRELQGARLEPFHCRAVVERIRELEIAARALDWIVHRELDLYEDGYQLRDEALFAARARQEW